MKTKVMWNIEACFDVLYLITGLVVALYLALNQNPAYFAAAVLVFGDAFHLIPRIAAAMSKYPAKYDSAKSTGKLVTSMTITAFYLILWNIAMSLGAEIPTKLTYGVYILAILRILLCVLPQNQWTAENPPTRWAIIRNLPFVLIGMLTAVAFFTLKDISQMRYMWIAIILSFAFYIPVILFSRKYPPVGALMLPKTCTYLWMLFMLCS